MNEYQTLLPLHMYLYFTFVTLSSYKSKLATKIRKLIGLHVRFYYFLLVI